MKLRLRSNFYKFIQLERSKAGFKMSVTGAGSDSQPVGFIGTQPYSNTQSYVANVLRLACGPKQCYWEGGLFSYLEGIVGTVIPVGTLARSFVYPPKGQEILCSLKSVSGSAADSMPGRNLGVLLSHWECRELSPYERWSTTECRRSHREEGFPWVCRYH